jgi:ryanodine receptor 2
VVDSDEKEKLETFINFCEDAIFEMQHASALMAVEESGGSGKAKESSYTYMTDEDEERKDPIRRKIQAVKDGIYFFFSMFSPTNIKNMISDIQQMSIPELLIGFFKLIFYSVYYLGFGISCIIGYFMKLLLNLMRGPIIEERIVEVKEDDIKTSRHLPALPSTIDESNLQVTNKHKLNNS